MGDIIVFPGATRPTPQRRSTVRFIASRPGKAKRADQLPLPLSPGTELERRITAAKANSAWYQDRLDQAKTAPERERLAKRLKQWEDHAAALIAEKTEARVQPELLPMEAAS